MTVSRLKLQTNIVNNDNLERRAFYALAGTLGVLFIAYIFFLGSITFNIVARKALDTEVKDTISSISELELRYLSLSNNLGLAYAGELGFSETKSATFISRIPAPANLALRGNGN